MTVKIIGTCSVCGGRVAVPNIWHGIYPPKPSCIDCDAVAASSGPVIPMKKRGSNGQRIIEGLEEALRHARGEDTGATERFPAPLGSGQEER